jgi:hypothetical protein
MQQLLPATPQSPQNDPVFETLAESIERCPGTDCRQCGSYNECVRWFDQRSGASVRNGGLTLNQLKQALKKFETELRPPVLGVVLFLPFKAGTADDGFGNLVIPVVIVVLSFSIAGLYVVVRRRHHVSKQL